MVSTSLFYDLWSYGYIAVISMVELLCLSVTRRYCIKMAKLRITQTTPHNSPGTPVFYAKDLSEIQVGSPTTGCKMEVG